MTQPQAIQPHPSLSKVAIFAGLSPHALKRIERRCAWRHYEPGEAILDYLDASDDVFIIGTGEVRVTIYSPRARR